MEGEAGILQQRIEALPVWRGGVEARERVGGEQQEGVETERNRRLCTQRRHMRLALQGPLQQRDQRARQPHHRDPQQHRTFVIAPGAREFIEPRLGAVAVHRDQQHRHVGAQEQRDEAAE
jgi:hypothetical protein